jgi:DNA-binding NarL/FixJ family response regulator
LGIRLMIVDDQDLVRAGFRMILESEPDIDVVAEASDGDEAIDLAQRYTIDVALMDIRMKRVDGIEATKRIVELRPTTYVLILTTFDLNEYVYEALRAGASGFLLKDAPPEQLVEAIRTVASGDALLAPAITRRVIEAYTSRPMPRENAAPPELAALTPREIEVLRLIARGRSNAEIAKELFLGETTVKTHVARILQKLGVRDRVQAVVVAYETGLVQPGDDDEAASPSG